MKYGFPVATPGMRVGLLGGSFDPAHEGHLRLTREALKRFGLNQVWWLVTPGNPLKAHQPGPMSERIAYAQGMIHDPRILVTGIEVRLQTRQTIDTISALQKIYPQVCFTWLMGSDNMVQFNKWDRWQEVAARVPIGILARPGSRLAARTSRAARILAAYRIPNDRAKLLGSATAPAWVQVNMPMSNASSTTIRTARTLNNDRQNR
ncbi:MAG: nicotinate-nucleotide adenylyltransferase [Paracoccus sp. (in: a-proteobacteria)]